MVNESEGVVTRSRTLAIRSTVDQHVKGMNPSGGSETNEEPMNGNTSTNTRGENENPAFPNVGPAAETKQMLPAGSVDGSKSYVDGATQKATDEVDGRSNVCNRFS